MSETEGPEPARSETNTGRPRRSRALRVAARLGVGVILIGVAVNLGLAYYSIKLGATRIIGAVSPGWLLVAALLGLVPVATHAVRILIWARFFGGSTTFAQALRAAFGTELGSAISPKAIGGAPVKMGMLVEAGVRPGAAASIALLNNLDDMLLFTVVIPVIAIVTARWEVPQVQDAIRGVFEKAAAMAPWLLIALVLGGGYWLWRRRRARREREQAHRLPEPGPIARARDDFARAWSLLGRRGKGRFLLALALTTFQWIARCSVATAVMYGLGQDVDPVLFFLLQWVVYATMIFIPTPGAALGAEASFAAILDAFIPEGLLGLVTAGWRFFTFYLVLMVGLVAVPALGRLAPQRSEPRPDPDAG